MIFFNLPSWWLSDPYITKIFCFLLILPMEIILFQSLNYQGGNLLVELLIKRGNYILPNPSTTLELYVIRYPSTRLLFKFPDFPKCHMCVHFGYLHQTFHYHSFNPGIHPILSSEKILPPNIQGCEKT